MNFLYLSLGILLLIFTILDIIKTAFSSNGGGKITNILARFVWQSFFLASGKKGSSRLLCYAGSAILLTILLAWVMGLWAGLFLILLSDPDSIVNSKTMVSAGASEKFYYAAFTLSTLGIGDYVAPSGFWRIVTSVASFMGLAFITTSITYFVPALSAVVLQSKLSLLVSSMGRTPQQILANSWNGKDFSSLFDIVPDLSQMLIQHTVNHHSYPVIHYFHNNKPELAISPAIVLLNEAHTLISKAVSQEVKHNQVKLTMLRTTLDAYLEMVKKNYRQNVSPEQEAPLPNLGKLREAGIPLQHEDEIKAYIQLELHEHTKILSSLLEKDGWTWQEVYQK